MIKFIIFSFLVSFAFCDTRIVGYWGATPGGHASTLPQLKTAVGKGYDVIIYAFYDVDAQGGLNQDPGSATAPTKSSIGGGNIKYLVSLFGGQNGAAPTLSISANQWAEAMYNNFVGLHKQFGFDGIDIDLENAWGGTPDQVVCGLRYFFQLMHSNGYFVSMAPQTTAITPQVSVYQAGSWNSYVPLIDTGVAEYVDILAVQLYNNAVPFNDPAQYAHALEAGFKISGCPSCPNTTCNIQVDAKKIAFGYPASNGAAPSGCPGLPSGCPYGSALSSLYNGSPVLLNTTGVMTWSIEWDEFAGWPFVTAATSIKFA